MSKKSAPKPLKTVDPRVPSIASNLTKILETLGEDPRREGLQETPRRFARSMTFLTSGYQANIDKIVGKALFSSNCQEMVIVRDIELYSLCEHHLLPFFGKAHVAYIPNGKVIGLSKIPRIVDAFARRLQIQEELTTQIADELVRILNPQGVAVIIDAKHFCMMMRGVEKQNSSTITSSLRGVFNVDSDSRKELMQLLTGLRAPY